MNRLLFLLLASVGLFLGGCSLAPEYIQPPSPVPEQWPRGEAYPVATTEDPLATALSRQEFFTDLRLQQVIEMSLKNNRDLQLAALTVERARALYGVQRAELFPAVNAAGTANKQGLSADMVSPGDPRTVESYSLDLGVAAWEIDLFGHLRSLKDQALEEYLATEEASRGVQISLVSEVARTYLTLAADKENLQLTRSTLEAHQSSYNLVRKQYEVGVATELDLKRARIPVDTARRDVLRYTRLVAQEYNSLQLLAGAPVPAELLPSELNDVSPPRDVSPGLLSDELLKRPDIMAAEHRLKGAYAFIGAARAALFPRISLTTAVGTASDQLSGLFGSRTDTWNFTPHIVMPIFDARVWAALRVSKADREIILTQYEKTIQIAFREVADSLAVKGTIDQQIEAQQSLVTAAADTYRLAEKRYVEGLDNYLGVLDAQRTLFSARQVLVVLRLARLVNRVSLYAVLGGGGD